MISGRDSPPSWPQPPIPAHLLRRRRPSSSLFTTPVIVVLVSIPTLVLSFFLIPKLWKGTVGVKRGWDSLNIVLVLCAVLCGIFAPRRDEEAAGEKGGRAGDNTRSLPKAEKAIEVMAQQWFQSIDRRIYELPEERVPVAGISRLRRNGGSYPDLMQESGPVMGEGRSQSFDDFAVDGNYQGLDQPSRVPLRRRHSAINESEIKEIPVDTFFPNTLSPPTEASPEQAKPRPPPNPPPTPPPPIAMQNKRPTYEYEAKGETATPPPPPPTPPPPPPPRREQSPVPIERRKSSAATELKVIIASVLSANKRKKRKLKAKTIEERDSVRHSVDETSDRRIPPPPPPPPHPQSFLSIFKKTSKSKKIHSASVQPPPPSPPPAEHGRLSSASRSTKPPLPKTSKNNRDDTNRRHPPPPPPSSFSSSRRRRSREIGISEGDGDVSWSPPTGKKRVTPSSDGDGNKQSEHVDGRDGVRGGPGPGFCESPDVNAKADKFIARLKDGWRLERMNSIKERHGLGPGHRPGPL